MRCVVGVRLWVYLGVRLQGVWSKYGKSVRLRRAIGLSSKLTREGSKGLRSAK